MTREQLQPFLHFFRDHTRIIIATSFVVFLIVFTIANASRAGKKPSQAALPQTTAPSPTPTTFKNWKPYENELRGYTVQIPADWEIEEIKGRAIFTATDEAKRIGSMKEVTITVVNTPQKNQPLTSDKEFTEWLQKDPKTEIPEKGRLYKLDNVTVARQEGVILVDFGKLGEQDSEDWSLVTWFRREKDNYYINAKGDKKMSDTDINAFNFLLRSLRFTEE